MSSGAVRRNSRAFGVILGFAGALLDFYSGYLLLTNTGMGASGMGTGTLDSTGLVWGMGIVALGVVLAVTTAASLSSMQARMKDLGALMVVYGLVMLFVGGSMATGLTSMVEGAIIPALGMLGIGMLMIANGAMMFRA